eukprot:m.137832 g.137832  ORF g.137832 m.137832 type:complete len:175 (-) comp9582_c0_seq3:3200-3724(-)
MIMKEQPARRGMVKIMADQMNLDYTQLKNALQTFMKKRKQKAWGCVWISRQEKADREREELLNSYATQAPRDRGESTTLLIDAAIEHNRQLNTASSGLDDLIANARGILGGLQEQRMTLKGAHRRIMDIASTLGLSNMVMRLVEQRESQDRLILFVGMAVTLAIMYAVYYYFGK